MRTSAVINAEAAHLLREGVVNDEKKQEEKSLRCYFIFVFQTSDNYNSCSRNDTIMKILMTMIMIMKIIMLIIIIIIIATKFFMNMILLS
jgi:hypothetical protein